MDGTGRVLVVAREDKGERIQAALTGRYDAEVTVESDVDAAIDRLSGADCVVAAADCDGTRETLLQRVRDRDASLPVVLFAEREQVVDGSVDAGVTSYVERADGYDALAEAVGRVLDVGTAGRSPGPTADATDSTADATDSTTDATTSTADAPTSTTDNNQLASVLEEATAELIKAETVEGVCEVAVEAAERVLGLPSIGIHLRADDGSFPPETVSEITRERLDGDVYAFESDGVIADIYASGEPRRVPAGESEETIPQVEVLVVPLERHGVLVASPPMADPHVDEPSKVARLLGTIVEAALDRVERERSLERLHETTRELMAAESESAVAEVTVDAARDVLGLEQNAVHLYDAEDEVLAPVAVSEATRAVLGGEPPRFERGDSLAWEVYEEGDHAVFKDVHDAEPLQNPDTEIRSELIVPLGSRGVFLAGTTTVADFDDSTVALAKLLASNVERALERAAREGALRRRERELERTNQRLEEFASVVSHDLRTPLSVATGNLELVAEECDSDHLAAIERAHDRMDELIDDLLTLAREGRSVGDLTTVDLGALAQSVWEPLSGGRLVLEDPGTVEADEGRLRALLENLLVNAVEHAGPDATVRIGRTDDGGFYLEDDGPGLPTDDPDRLFEYGYTDSEEGTGLGLAIVRRVAEAHDWTVSAAEGDAGARFEVRPEDP